ncbi:hypothetical protein SAMD00019534_019140 [Acytostelium subglobosum LB1]|uniref:hypothetical protein n=1 Tax=Acytostelium subglobosum LB1 TaxID=1410327 RepID=UPI0006449D02|nr:hypothetical protein SAMD00019534_019140 [Acytostelium subglobosum LB1]GAM18739.1 hypothetical protein SAMD00019534_019140 [Acytostelium subglobosum LB1]|eukprot:XP_012757959.1 hypothetical protein SAMD00019534_019140 [Acytostelium subglobosum LB1]
MNLCEINKTNNNNNNINTHNGTQTLNQDQLDHQQTIEYSICSLFSILYPFNTNFGQQQQYDLNGQSLPLPFVPLPPTQPVLWSDFEVDVDCSSSAGSEDTTISSCSTSDSMSDDIAMLDKCLASSKRRNIVNNNNNITNNNNNNNKVPTQANSNQKKKDKLKRRIFVGGIILDDLSHLDNQEEIKKLRTDRLLYLFGSCGKIDKVDPHFDQGYCFITFSAANIAQRTVKQFANAAKKFTMLEKIQLSLAKEGKDIRATPLPSFYVRLSSTH